MFELPRNINNSTSMTLIIHTQSNSLNQRSMNYFIFMYTCAPHFDSSIIIIMFLSINGSNEARYLLG
jgi:hypothetical protein